MKARRNILLLLLLVSTTALDSQAQKDCDNSGLYLMGAPQVELQVTPKTWGSGPSSDSDDSTNLIWSNAKNKSKVTVSTFSPDQQFGLFVEAVDVDNARSGGTIRLIDGMMDTDLIVNIKNKESGSARLVYTAEATIDQGSSDDGYSDVHTVTYTLTDQ